MIDCGNGMICNFTEQYNSDCIRLILEPEDCICFGASTCDKEEVIDDPDCPTWECFLAPTTTTTTMAPPHGLSVGAEVGFGTLIFVGVLILLVMSARFICKCWNRYVPLDDAEEAIGNDGNRMARMLFS